MNISGVTMRIKKFLSNLKKTAEVPDEYEANPDQYMTLAGEIAELYRRNRQLQQAADEAFHEVGGTYSDYGLSHHKNFTDLQRFMPSFMYDIISNKMRTKGRPTTRASRICNCNDEEITETSVIDPITKGPLLKPVINRRCGHIYGYQSVMDSLAINPRLRCPTVGCSNKQSVNQNDLMEL